MNERLFQSYTSGPDRIATPKQLERVIKRVDKGIAFLDKNEPEWMHRLDVHNLRMSDGKFCVLGQVFSNYGRGLRLLGIRDDSDERYSDSEDRWARAHGFYALEDQHCHYIDGGYPVLDIVWSHAISDKNGG